MDRASLDEKIRTINELDTGVQRGIYGAILNDKEPIGILDGDCRARLSRLDYEVLDDIRIVHTSCPALIRESIERIVPINVQSEMIAIVDIDIFQVYRWGNAGAAVLQKAGCRGEGN